jgi:hypothetical protein
MVYGMAQVARNFVVDLANYTPASALSLSIKKEHRPSKT